MGREREVGARRGGLPLAARIGVMYDSSARSWVEERVV